MAFGDLNRPTLRSQRLRLTWPLAVPFLYFARPSLQLLLVGFLISFFGLLLRGVAAGFIHKDQELAVGGPYRLLRHPLYLGSFFLGLGLSLAGGRWWFPVLYSGLFLWLYSRTIQAEEAELLRRFGRSFESYRQQVPAVIPRTTGHAELPPSPGFRFWLYRRNKEWQAALGALVAYGLLLGKLSLLL